MSKFNPGDEVVLFNSISCEFEHDIAYGVLFVPIANNGVEQDKSKSIAERIADGEMRVQEQYQTQQHQIVDAEVLFATEDEARQFYLDLLNK